LFGVGLGSQTNNSLDNVEVLASRLAAIWERIRCPISGMG
jgi:hypothetical protein